MFPRLLHATSRNQVICAWTSKVALAATNSTAVLEQHRRRRFGFQGRFSSGSTEDASFGVCRDFHALAREKAQSTREDLEELEPRSRFESVPGRAQEEVQLLTGGAVFEKATIHLGDLHGVLPKEMGNAPFRLSSITCWVHPNSPFVPTLQFNYRLWASKGVWTLAGGSSLHPSYIDPDGCTRFHSALKSACEGASAASYPKFKKTCDSFFHLPHRGEHLGVGGIFFDGLQGDSTELFEFVDKCISGTLQAYGSIVEKQNSSTFGVREKEWQLFRRGRLVEFILRGPGTNWGLQNPELVDPENVLLCMPPDAKFHYRCTVPVGTHEADAMHVFKTPRDWAEHREGSDFSAACSENVAGVESPEALPPWASSLTRTLCSGNS